MSRARPTPHELHEGLDGLPGGGLNVAHEAVARHAASDRRDRVALRWDASLGPGGQLTYAQLERLTRRFANVLEGLSIERGDRVICVMGEMPELYVTALGALRHGAVFGLLRPDLATDALRSRLTAAEARVLVSTVSIHDQTIRWIRDGVGTLDYVILIGDDRGPTDVDHTLDWIGLVHDTEAVHRIGECDPEDPALLCFEDGPAGPPTYRCYAHEAVLLHHFDDGQCPEATSFLHRLAPLTRGETIELGAR